LAEAIVNAKYKEQWKAFSAGTEPAGFVHPLAIQVLSEIGINHQGRSKHVDELRRINFDLVVTVCDNAVETCPVWLGPGTRIHIGFPDPAKVTGDDEFVMATFRQVRDDILKRIPRELEMTND
jgi:arsenate reductase